jgi:hypothetical protein
MARRPLKSPRVLAESKRAKELFKQGLNYVQIGARLGKSSTRARELVLGFNYDSTKRKGGELAETPAPRED